MQKNVDMTLIDYKKANDMVSQSWIVDCQKMYKISGEIIKFTTETMQNSIVKLTSGVKSLV